MAAHDADTRQFLADLALLSDELAGRAGDVVSRRRRRSTSPCPTLNENGDASTRCWSQTGRLARRRRRPARRQPRVHRQQLRRGRQDARAARRPPRRHRCRSSSGCASTSRPSPKRATSRSGDGTLMAAVKGILGGDLCDLPVCPVLTGAGSTWPRPRPALPRPRRRLPSLLEQAAAAAAVPTATPATGHRPHRHRPRAAAVPPGDPHRHQVRHLRPRLPLVHGLARRSRSATSSSSRDRYSLTATFDDVTGLSPNDNVKIAGVVVGKVTGHRRPRRPTPG